MDRELRGLKLPHTDVLTCLGIEGIVFAGQDW